MFCPASSEGNYPSVVVSVDENIVRPRITPYYSDIRKCLDGLFDLACPFLLPGSAMVLMSIRPSLGISGFGVMSVIRIPTAVSFPDSITPQSLSDPLMLSYCGPCALSMLPSEVALLPFLIKNGY